MYSNIHREIEWSNITNLWSSKIQVLAYLGSDMKSDHIFKCDKKLYMVKYPSLNMSIINHMVKAEMATTIERHLIT